MNMPRTYARRTRRIFLERSGALCDLRDKTSRRVCVVSQNSILKTCVQATDRHAERRAVRVLQSASPHSLLTSVSAGPGVVVQKRDDSSHAELTMLKSDPGFGTHTTTSRLKEKCAVLCVSFLSAQIAAPRPDGAARRMVGAALWERLSSDEAGAALRYVAPEGLGALSVAHRAFAEPVEAAATRAMRLWASRSRLVAPHCCERATGERAWRAWRAALRETQRPQIIPTLCVCVWSVFEIKIRIAASRLSVSLEGCEDPRRLDRRRDRRLDRITLGGGLAGPCGATHPSIVP